MTKQIPSFFFDFILLYILMNNNHTYNKKCDKWRKKITLTMKN